MRQLTDDEFDGLISRAMDELPQQYIHGLVNVAIVYADYPDEHQAKKARLEPGNLLLGLYEGIPLTQRGAGYNLVLPDKITLFKESILQIVGDGDETALFATIKRTLWHEIAHYYGLDHDRIDELERKS